MREGLEFGKVEEESVEMDMDTDMDEIGREMKKKKKKQKRRRRERGLVKETNTVVKGECYPAAQRGFFQLFVLMNLRYHLHVHGTGNASHLDLGIWSQILY